MHTELGRSQVEVQRCTLSWAAGEELGDELARLARGKWRWKRRRRGGGRGGQLVEEEEEEEAGGGGHARNIAKTIQKRNNIKDTKRVREKTPGGNAQGPMTIFEAKGKKWEKMKMPKGGKTGMKNQ